MVSKICAAWLIVLVVLPFTAPFSAFDLRTWNAAQNRDGIGLAPSSKAPAAVTSQAALARAVPLPPRVGRQRLALSRVRMPLAITAVPHTARVARDVLTSPAVPPASRLIALRV